LSRTTATKSVSLRSTPTSSTFSIGAEQESSLTETDGFLGVAAFCRQYGCGRTRCFALLSEGKLQARRFGARTLIERASAVQWALSLPRWEPTGSRGHTDTDERR
jgi:hypothetical protein